MTIGSGVCVLAALVLLVLGLVQGSLALVYGSVAASVLAFALLIAAVRGRRHEAAPRAHGPSMVTPPGER